MNVRITKVGTGYVGLVTGACFAELGHDVICVDKDERKIDMLRQGKMPIYDPASMSWCNAMLSPAAFPSAQIFPKASRIATRSSSLWERPQRQAPIGPTLKCVFAAAAQIATAVTGFTVIVTKSTVPVGTNRQVFDIAKANLNPEAEIRRRVPIGILAS